MTQNVPADSLIYLEANNLTAISDAISSTQGWQNVAAQLGYSSNQKRDRWLAWLARTTGIGSTQAVVATRSQLAFVLLDVGAVGNGEALEVKSQAALLVETHTSSARVQPAMEKALGALASRVYHQPRIERATVDGSEFIRWIAPDGQRRIVAAIDGSLVVIGNDERAVSACLAARHGQRPSLFHNAGLEEMRSRVKGNEALAFGFASSTHAAQLIAVGAPIFVLKRTLDPQLQKVLGTGAANLLGSVGWSARPFQGGIEDQYLVDLKPDIAPRLQAAFAGSTDRPRAVWEFVPPEVDSVTRYSLREPAGAWDDFNAVVSSHLDVLSAIVFTASFKDILNPYGIDDPKTFLEAVGSDILTVRLEPAAERALVIARISDPAALHRFVDRRFGGRAASEQVGYDEFLYSADGEFAAAFAGDYFLLGTPADVRRSLSVRNGQLGLSEKEILTRYVDGSGNASVITYAKDGERARGFINAIASMRGDRIPLSANALDSVVASLPLMVTETTMGSNGLERRTRSPFGQFSSLISFLAPEPAGATR